MVGRKDKESGINDVFRRFSLFSFSFSALSLRHPALVSSPFPSTRMSQSSLCLNHRHASLISSLLCLALIPYLSIIALLHLSDNTCYRLLVSAQYPGILLLSTNSFSSPPFPDSSRFKISSFTTICSSSVKKTLVTVLAPSIRFRSPPLAFVPQLKQWTIEWMISSRREWRGWCCVCVL